VTPLAHILRFPDCYTPREMAIVARREGVEVEIPAAIIGETLADRAADLMTKKGGVISKIIDYRKRRRGKQ